MKPRVDLSKQIEYLNMLKENRLVCEMGECGELVLECLDVLYENFLYNLKVKDGMVISAPYYIFWEYESRQYEIECRVSYDDDFYSKIMKVKDYLENNYYMKFNCYQAVEPGTGRFGARGVDVIWDYKKYLRKIEGLDVESDNYLFGIEPGTNRPVYAKG